MTSAGLALFQRGLLVLAAIGCAFSITTAQATIVRGSGGTSNDGEDDEARIYITPTFATHPGALSSESDQLWIVGYEYLPVPREAEIDPDHAGLDDCAPGGVIFCEYSVGPGESRRLAVEASRFFGSNGVPLAAPTLGIIWHVLNLTDSRTFTFEDQDVDASTLDYDLVLNGLPAGTYTITVEFHYSLPAGYEFYRAAAPFSGDIRNAPAGGHATALGSVFSVTGHTKLTIDPAAVDADVTAPVSSASAAPPPNANGWNASSVSVTINSADEAGGSGLELISYAYGGSADSSPTSPVMVNLTAEGVTQVDFYAVDQEGNQETAKQHTVRIDLTNPLISASTIPSANANGWRKTAVTVSFSCSDSLSGIDSCSSGQSLTSEGAGQSASGTATDKAGNTAGATASGINIDLTVPSISGVATPAPNGAGWNNTNVLADFSCTDALSGIDSCGPDTTLSANGSGQSASGEALDRAGNSATTSITGINIDKVKPVVAVTGVSQGAVYPPGAVPAAGCSTTDALSGVNLAATLGLTGGSPNNVGAYTASCSGATDNAGNAGDTASADYEVHYSFQGFFSPVDNLPVFNRAKAGQAIPLKFSLAGNRGLNILAAGSPYSQAIACNSGLVDDIEETASPAASTLSYDALTGQYSYAWKTPKTYAGTCRVLVLTLDDGTTHSAYFSFK